MKPTTTATTATATATATAATTTTRRKKQKNVPRSVYFLLLVLLSLVVVVVSTCSNGMEEEEEDAFVEDEDYDEYDEQEQEQQQQEEEQQQQQQYNQYRDLQSLCDPITTADDLRIAIENVPRGVKRPATVIRICTEQMDVTESYLTSFDDGSEFDGDSFGYNIIFKNIVLRCNINTTIETGTQNKQRCVLNSMDGTGMFYMFQSKLVLKGFHIQNGGSIFHNAGGAIQMYKSNLTLYDTAFVNNTAQNGGAIYSRGSNDQRQNHLVLNGTTSTRRNNTDYNVEFIKNQAWGGGAIDTHSTRMFGTNILFEENIATRFGGAICLYCECNSILVNCIFYKNYVGGDGGAIFTSETGTAIFDNTLFRYNLARLNSPAIDVTGTYKVEVRNSTIARNVVNVIREVFDLFDNVPTRGEAIYDPMTEMLAVSVSNTSDDINLTSFVFGERQDASAVRSLSPEGVIFTDTVFTKNSRAPTFELANLYVFGNGTADCDDIIFCGDERGIETDSFVDNSTSCKSKRFTNLVPQDRDACDITF